MGNPGYCSSLLPWRILHHCIEHRADQRGRFSVLGTASLADHHHPRRDRDIALADDLQEFDECRVAAADLLGDQLVSVRLGLGLDCHRLGLRLGSDHDLLLVLFCNLDLIGGRRQSLFFLGLLLGLGELLFLLGSQLLDFECLLFLERNLTIFLCFQERAERLFITHFADPDTGYGDSDVIQRIREH